VKGGNNSIARPGKFGILGACDALSTHRVLCCWARETVSEWAARSVSTLHPQLAPIDVAHVTRVEGPDDGAGGQQLTLP
jgi:hypothetical protein